MTEPSNVFQLVKAYDHKDGEKKARFEDQFGLVSLKLPKGEEINVFDSHAETVWFSTVQATPASQYPEAAEEGDALLVLGSPYLVPPNPEAAARIASGQGPVYRILEEEMSKDGAQVPLGYISRDESDLPAIDYLEGLEQDVSGDAPRAKQGTRSLGGVLFKHLDTKGSDIVEKARSANGQGVHIFNNKGVAQRVATQHFKKSKRSENLAKWSAAALHGDFGTENGRFRFVFAHEDAADKSPKFHYPGWKETINTSADLGLTLDAAGFVTNVSSSSPALSVGLNTESPWAYLDKEKRYKNLHQKLQITRISWTMDEQQLEDQYQSAQYSEGELDRVISTQPKVLILWREPIADSATVRHALDENALGIRNAEVEKLQNKAEADGWFVKVEKLKLTAWPPGDSEDARHGLGPFPADWPGYHLEDSEGQPVTWDPLVHAEPHDEDFYAREFVKQYAYVLARGSTKGPSGPSGDKWMGLTGLYAGLYGYNNTQAKTAGDLAELFPDRNFDTRVAYGAGLQSQIPRAFVNFKEDADGENAFKASLLRLAFVLGLNFSGRKAEDIVPSTDKLRAAYKDGKRAVAVGITEEIWKGELGGGDDHKLEVYERLAVPVELVNVGPRGSEDQEVREVRNYLLKQVWQQGVRDAWQGRKEGVLTAWTASKRVPDGDDGASLLEAFKLGSESSKRAADNLSGSNLVVRQQLAQSDRLVSQQLDDIAQMAAAMDPRGGGMELAGEHPSYVSPDMDDEEFRAVAKRLAFKDGLQQAWESIIDPDAKEPEKADERYPNTSEDLLKAYEDGVQQRARDDKKKVLEEDEKVEEEVDECAQLAYDIFCTPCHMCYDMCCPMCERNEETGLCELCGTTCSDWLLILACFMFWYTFMGFWYWSLIEILLAVAEPQRPW